jgi:hypothetical protein
MVLSLLRQYGSSVLAWLMAGLCKAHWSEQQRIVLYLLSNASTHIQFSA